MNDGVENKRICTAKLVNGAFAYEIKNKSDHEEACAGLKAVNKQGNFIGIYKGSKNWSVTEGDCGGVLNSSGITYFVNLENKGYKWIKNIGGEIFELMELTNTGKLRLKRSEHSDTIDTEVELSKIGNVQGFYIDGETITFEDLKNMGWAKCDGTTPASQSIEDPIMTGNTPSLKFVPANEDVFYFIKVK